VVVVFPTLNVGCHGFRDGCFLDCSCRGPTRTEYMQAAASPRSSHASVTCLVPGGQPIGHGKVHFFLKKTFFFFQCASSLHSEPPQCAHPFQHVRAKQVCRHSILQALACASQPVCTGPVNCCCPMVRVLECVCFFLRVSVYE
jgi:hypothetical protein